MNTDLMKDEDILKASEARSDAFIQSDSCLKDIKLRPFTAGSLLICKKVGNKLISGLAIASPKDDGKSGASDSPN